MIRSQLRSVGHFLLAVKEVNSDISDFALIYRPKYFNSVMEAIHKVGRLTTEGKCEATSNVADAGTMIRQCAKMLDREY